MAQFSRADNSTLGRWWWTVDRWTLGCIGLLIGFGYVLMLAASPSVAARIGAANTLVRQQDGSLKAYNTDWSAAIKAVEAGLGGQHPSNT